MTCKHRVDLFHIRVGDRPAERAGVVVHFARIAASHQRRADDWIRQRPAQRKLRKRLVVPLRNRLQILDGAQIVEKVFGAEEMLKQVDVSELAAARSDGRSPMPT